MQLVVANGAEAGHDTRSDVHNASSPILASILRTPSPMMGMKELYHSYMRRVPFPALARIRFVVLSLFSTYARRPAR